VISQHSQDPDLAGPTACCHEGELSGRLGLPGWPGIAEETIVARDVMLAEHTNSRVHVAHVSTAGSVEVIRWAKAQGIDVTPEGNLERLARSGDGSGIPVDLEQLRAEMAVFCQATVAPDCAVRLIITRGGQRIWREEPLPALRVSLDLMPVAHRVTPLLVGVKTLSYAANMRAQRTAKEAGADDALLYRVEARAILEGPVWSFPWPEGDTPILPPPRALLLPHAPSSLVPTWRNPAPTPSPPPRGRLAACAIPSARLSACGSCRRCSRASTRSIRKSNSRSSPPIGAWT